MRLIGVLILALAILIGMGRPPLVAQNETYIPTYIEFVGAAPHQDNATVGHAGDWYYIPNATSATFKLFAFNVPQPRFAWVRWQLVWQPRSEDSAVRLVWGPPGLPYDHALAAALPVLAEITALQSRAEPDSARPDAMVLTLEMEMLRLEGHPVFIGMQTKGSVAPLIFSSTLEVYR